MILRIPDYFEDFHCLGDKCPDSCCVGWELEIDEATYGYYQSVPGAFGDRLRASIAEAEEDGEAARTFCLKVDGRCPFLDDRNLCEIVRKLGPEALPEVCTEYPRRTFCFGPYMTRSLTLSCPEVARMLLTSEPPVRFPEVDLAERVSANKEIFAAEDGPGEDHSSDAALSPSEGEGGLEAGFVAKVRDLAIELLEDRSLSFRERLNRYHRFAEAVQQAIDRGEPPADPAYILYNIEETPSEIFAPDRRAAFSERLELLGELEVLTPHWEAELIALAAMADDPPETEFYDDVRAEHLMTYYTDRYFPLAWYDGDILGKAEFAVFSLLTQMDMLALRARKRGEKPAARDWIEVVSLYSKEVENLEYNTELLL